MKLSKSQYTRGLQCKKSLWLKKNTPELLTKPDKAMQAVFETGNQVGEFACSLFPNGKEIPYEGTSFIEKIALTKKFIEEGIQNIYEATFEFDGILVMVDILHKGENGWEIYEVKSSTKLSKVYIDDASIQYYVLNGCGYDVSKVSIVYLNNQYIRSDELDIGQLFVKEKITELVLDKQGAIPAQLKIFLTYLNENKTEPNDIDIGAHCSKPYPCDAHDYCWKHIPDYSVFNIFNMGSKPIGLYKDGIINVEDIPEKKLTTERQKFVVDAWIHRHRVVDKDEINYFLSTLTYPIYHFDFETFMQAVPEFKGTKPYQQIPFQYSLHIEHEDGTLDHVEFLGVEGTDPREKLIKSMIANIPEGKTILVYNENFEKTRLKELARDFPEYSQQLNGINSGIVDLAEPFRKKYYYEPEMKGKYSIKIILPILVPDMASAYKELDLVQNGGDAMNIFPRLINMSHKDKSMYREALLKYCHLDTLAMVELLKKLKKETL